MEVYNQYVDLIVSKLTENFEKLKEQFTSSQSNFRTRYAVVDQLLPEHEAIKIYNAFPNLTEMREMKSIREHKHTSKNFSDFDSRLSDISLAFQDKKVMEIIEKITGIDKQIGDPSFYAGGLSSMSQGHFLDPHIDNSHEATRKAYRRLNLLYYVTPSWKEEYGGHLELWDRKVRNKVTIHSLFNRLVLMETNALSWHSVSKVNVNKTRNCVSNYYFSYESPTGEDYFHITKFAARPEDRYKRVYYFFDGMLRTSARKLFKYGLGKSDLAK